MKINLEDWIDREEEELRLLLPEGTYHVNEYPNTITTGKEGLIIYILICQQGMKESLERCVRWDGHYNKDS